ncbi:MAG: UDP-3-O-(3-hydroxymyristoyl)glucosamine N-acyltransferase [Terriglobia bacterium]
MTVSEIAKLLSGEAAGDATREIRGVAALASAGPDDLTFAEGERALAQAATSNAGCILIPTAAKLEGRTTIAVPQPKLALIRAAEAICPPKTPEPGIHPTAVISADARLAADVSVGPYAVVESGASVGPGTRLGAGVFLGEGSQIGAGCVLYPRVTVYAGARIGDRVILHAGVVIGSDGFGYVFAEGRYHKFPQLGQVILEDDVEIGANSTVDRGSLGVTVVGRGTKVDNLVQIAHNVRIGRHCVIAAQTGISGSCEIGDYVVMGGQVGVADHVRLEEHVVVGAQAGIPTGKIIRKGATVWGTPARPLEDFKRIYAHLSQLPNLAEKVKEISAQLLKRG